MSGPWEKYGGTAAPSATRAPPRQARPSAPQIRFTDARDALARTLIGEAGNQGDDGMLAVGGVVMNRARSRGLTPEQVVLERNQFEPWGNPETTRRLLSISPDSPEYRRAAALADRALQGEDVTGGASHFYAPKAQAQLGRPKPSWDNGTGRAIGDHLFFSLEGGNDVNLISAPSSAESASGPWNRYAERSTDPRDLLGSSDGPQEVEIDRGVIQTDDGAYTVNRDGQRVSLGADWDALSPEERRARMDATINGRSEGYTTALNQEREALERVGGVDFSDQFTAPLNDEIAGLVGYLSQGAGNIARRATGRDIEVTAAERGGAAMDATRQAQEAFQKENPIQALGGGLLGGFAFAPAKGAAIPGIMGRLGQSAAIGGAYGVAEGEGAAGRVGSGLIGAGLAGLTAGAFEAAPAYGRAVSRDIEGLLRPPAAAPLSRPEQRVAGAIERSISRDVVAPGEMLGRMGQRAEGQLPFEMAGDNLVGLAEVLAQSPGRGRTALLNAIEQRQGGVNDRITNRLSESFGAEGNYFQALRQRISERGAQATAGMGQIADTMVPLNDNAVRAFRSGLSSKAVREAALEATADLSDDAAQAANRLFSLGDTALDNPGAAQITVREAQDISFALKEAASRAYRGGFNARGEALQNLSSAIRQNAREAVPAYDQWLKSFGDASEHIDALRAGRNVFAKATDKNSASAPELAERFASWSADAQDQFRRGVGEAILDQVRTGQGGVAAMRRLIKSDEFGERIRVAFPSDEAFARFIKSAEDEVLMQARTNQVISNSATDRRGAARADLQQQSGVDPLELIDIAGDVTSPIAMTGKALKELLKRVPRADRSILGDENLNDLLGRALADETVMTGLLNRMEAMRALRANADRRVSGLGLLTAPGVPAAGQERSRGLLTANP